MNEIPTEIIEYINKTLHFKIVSENNTLNIFIDDWKLGRGRLPMGDNIVMNYNREVIVNCDFSEIFHLSLKDLPRYVVFNFHFLINENLYFNSIKKEDDKIIFNFEVNVTYEDYKEKINPILKFNNFYENIINIENCIGEYNELETDAIHQVFSFYIVESNKNLKNEYDNIIKNILEQYNMPLDFFKNENVFEAIFNFPEQYQSMLKPYLLYFEEFLNDLCIETDVNIQKIGKDTILSVEPKNKDEALEKIADALKAYLCAPVIAEGVSMEESLQMQTTLTKLYAQCKNLESQMMYKELTLKEQNQQLELKENIINESKRVLVEAGVDTNIITQNNTMLLDSLKSIKINGEETKKKTFLSSIKAKVNVSDIFKGSLELKRDKI